MRVIATSCRDLEQEAGAGRFRRDLFFGLNVVALLLPPLRNRSEDTKPLSKRVMVKYDRGG